MEVIIALCMLILSASVIVAFFMAVLELKAIHRTLKHYGRLFDSNAATPRKHVPPPIANVK